MKVASRQMTMISYSNTVALLRTARRGGRP